MRPRQTRNGRQSGRAGGRRRQKHTPPGNVSPAAEPFCCEYCFCTDWRTDKRQRYCTPSRERKLAHYRRRALVEALYRLLPWHCGVTQDVARRMVQAAEGLLLRALWRLGWGWDEARKQFVYVMETRGTTA